MVLLLVLSSAFLLDLGGDVNTLFFGVGLFSYLLYASIFLTAIYINIWLLKKLYKLVFKNK